MRTYTLCSLRGKLARARTRIVAAQDGVEIDVEEKENAKDVV